MKPLNPDYIRIRDLAKSLLAELGQQGDDADPDWYDRAAQGLQDTIAAAAGALAVIDRLHGREVTTARQWRTRCSEALDVGRAVVPEAVLGQGKVKGRRCSRCKRVLPAAVYASPGWCPRCQGEHYAAGVATKKMWAELK